MCLCGLSYDKSDTLLTGSTPQHNITTVADSWKYNTGNDTWTQLSSLPVASGNFNSGTVFADRYILLIGGYQYANTTLQNGTNIPSYGMPQRMCSAASKLTDAHCRPTCTSDTTDVYFNDIFVHDAKMDMFGVATASSTSEPCRLPPVCSPYQVNVNAPQKKCAWQPHLHDGC